MAPVMPAMVVVPEVPPVGMMPAMMMVVMPAPMPDLLHVAV
jgi:hypothetical protein